MEREGMECGGAAGRRGKGEARNVNGRGGKELDSPGKDGMRTYLNTIALFSTRHMKTMWR